MIEKFVRNVEARVDKIGNSFNILINSKIANTHYFNVLMTIN